MNYRPELERAILGAILIENCYSIVCQVVSSKNFTGNNRIIMQTIESVFPNKPIDSVILSYQLNEQGHSHLIQEVATCMQHVNSCHHVISHALILLQYDLKDKCTDILNRLILSVDMEKDRSKVLEKQAYIRQIQNDVNNESILLILPAAVKFLKSHNIL